jgi:hypothetical protein
MINLYDEVTKILAKRFNLYYDLNLKNDMIIFLRENYGLYEE